MPVERIEEIVATTNGLAPDAILLLGDYAAATAGKHGGSAGRVGSAAGQCRAPLGVHAVLGNHDWWDDLHVAVQARKGRRPHRIAIGACGIPVYENEAVRLEKDGRAVLAGGAGRPIAFFAGYHNGRGQLPRHRRSGRHAGQVTDDAPVILMAHEPDIFPRVPARVPDHLRSYARRPGAHNGLFAGRAVAYGNRYAYGHIVEDGRHLVVSGGLGCSIVPVRFGVPPEIVVIELGPSEPIAA